MRAPLRSSDLIIGEEEPQREIQTERLRRRKYNINKYKEVPRAIAQVEPEQAVKDTYFSHTDLEVQKFTIDTIWRQEEKNTEVVMKEPLMRYNSCTSQKYKKKEIVRVDDVLIKNISISNIDNVLGNSIEKLYRVTKDFIRQSDKLESDIGPEDF
ncbi:MAG: hypothetical protein EZS28_004547 [Streblomastix strix]|uniref:Uncharacterized protein n=1 Tax=Streblomastix strix TaxID=222440 RepID=A0A5J4WYJ9_9EUKA|nr:MAG: hypothetical protein EZS28_004547 [Streblomastix strix]